MYSHDREDWHFKPTYTSRDLGRGADRNWRILFKSLVSSKITSLAFILAAIFMQFSAATGAQAGGRVALVLACEDYENFNDSPIAAKWARELGQVLREQSFDLTVAVNGKDAETRAALREFSLKAEQADFALIVVSGHMVGYQNQPFFLPQNAKIQRATDLFSRASSLASIVDIGSKAKSGAVLVLMTVPDFATSIPDLDARPATNGVPPPNVVTVFSSSPKIPVSGVDRVSQQAADKLLKAARERPLTLTSLINSASSDGVGTVVGEVLSIDLSAQLDRSAPVNGLRADSLEAAAKAQAEAERKAREASVARDRAETDRQAAEKRIREETARARVAEERARDAEQRASQVQEEASRVASLPSTQLIEDSLRPIDRLQVQRRLQTLRLYQGRLDAVFGDQTRVAIREFQKLAGAPETGYLTRSQFERLVDNR